MRERVDALIARVMAEHPRLKTSAAQLRYFEAVHQELAPLARALEVENDSLHKQLQARWREANEERKPKYRVIYTCPTCRNVYRAGDQDVTIYAHNGAIVCRKCVTPQGGLSVMQETREARS